MYINTDYDIDDVVAFVSLEDRCIRIGTVYGLRVVKDGDEQKTVYIVHFTDNRGLNEEITLDSEQVLFKLDEWTSRTAEFEKFARMIFIDTPRMKRERNYAAKKEAERLQALEDGEYEEMEADKGNKPHDAD